jgi:predicted PurR-regulated permease PerM
MANQRIKQFGVILGALALAIVASVITAFPVKWLWNWLVPEIFGLKTISALQAWGLVLLLHLLVPRNRGVLDKRTEE